MKRDSASITTTATDIDVGLAEGNALLVQVTGTSTPDGTVDFQGTIDGVTFTNTPYILKNSVTAAKTVAQISSPTTVTTYILLPPLTQARIAVGASSSGTINVVYREIEYARPFDGAFADSEEILLGDSGDVSLKWDGTNFALTLASGDISVVGGSILLDDNEGIFLGTGNDASIKYDGSDIKIVPDLVGTGRVWIDAGDTGHTPSSEAFLVVEEQGADVYIEILGSTTSDQRLIFSDNASARAYIGYNQNVDRLTFASAGAKAGSFDSGGNLAMGTGNVVIADSSGNLTSANGHASFSGAITNLTVVKGIVTAAS